MEDEPMDRRENCRKRFAAEEQQPEHWISQTGLVSRWQCGEWRLAGSGLGLALALALLLLSAGVWAQTVGKGSCVGEDACEGNTGPVGNASCLGDEACFDNSGPIRNNACLGRFSCYL